MVDIFGVAGFSDSRHAALLGLGDLAARLAYLSLTVVLRLGRGLGNGQQSCSYLTIL